MFLILWSILLGVIGFIIGSFTNVEWIGLLGMMVGVLSPGLYTLENLYKVKCKEIKLHEDKK